MRARNLNLPKDENGKPKPHPGRPKGVPNKTGVTIKEAIMKTFQNLGGTKWLEKLANDEPKAFAQLLSRVMPQGVQSVDENGKTAPLSIKIVYTKPDEA